MQFLKIPLEVSNGHLEMIDDEVHSIDQSIALFLNTPKWTLASDPSYGFEFAGLRFEIFDENNGTVYNSMSVDRDDPIYKKKISGSSKNFDTFASDLGRAIKEYEPRLLNTKVNMTYIRENRQVLLVVRGAVAYLDRPYEYRTVIKVWSR